MKTNALFLSAVLVVSLLVTTASAQNEASATMLKKLQSTKIKGVKGEGIIPIFEAFNNKWETDAGNSILLKHRNPTKFNATNIPDNGPVIDVVIDQPNGYVSADNGGGDGDYIEACIWKRTNGHRLFAVHLGDPVDPEIDLICFYDYNPATKTLTPEKSSVNSFKPFFKGNADNYFSYSLPRKGKDLIVEETYYGWHDPDNILIEPSLHHIYTFDGMDLRYHATKVECYDKLMESFSENAIMSDEDAEMTRLALIDVDNDDTPEIWLSDSKGENSSVYCVSEGKAKLIGEKNFKYGVTFYKDVVLTSGGCGTGCYYTSYSHVKNSNVDYVLNCIATFPVLEDGEIGEEYEYSKNEQELTRKEGEKIVKSFGEPIELNPVWHPLAK